MESSRCAGAHEIKTNRPTRQSMLRFRVQFSLRLGIGDRRCTSASRLHRNIVYDAMARCGNKSRSIISTQRASTPPATRLAPKYPPMLPAPMTDRSRIPISASALSYPDDLGAGGAPVHYVHYGQRFLLNPCRHY